ncbi:MAG: thiol oxidoreductase [Rhodospirillaceae bacterium]|nr:thiol oxidoreductase [Rhodospirillaceae bacterium]|tara:strand:- start:184 stop:1581 length:1398 start_codon:yes stop_codon:yes gene_type:complete
MPTGDFSLAEKYEFFSAGAATSRKKINSNSFSQNSANMKFSRELDFKVGNSFFRRIWVTAPASTQAADGLGPLFNARSCQRCHLKDGRGHPPAAKWPEDNAVSMLIRLSIPPQNKENVMAVASGRRTVIGDPVYGGQLQDRSIINVPAEGNFKIDYREKKVELNGGEIAYLRRPTYSIFNLGYGSLHPQIMMSPRVAPPMIGLGFLEAIAEKDILAQEDPDDKDGDGISGKANRVWSPKLKRVALGRFGWKAGIATMEDQVSAAFLGDIGISTPLFPKGRGECTDAQKECVRAPTGNSPRYANLEVDQQIVDLVTFYSRNLAVPARRNFRNKSVLAGKKHFYKAGCIACHRPKYITPRNIPGMPEQSRQLIWPYTDLLLHDMGDGLADNRPEGHANGREWRTPPLWGIGLTKTVNKHTFFLHDGRARSLLEAILWHGGEAESAKQKVIKMQPEERKNLIRFLESL